MSSKQINGVDDVKSLFNSAVDDGDLSTQASVLMINSLDGSNLVGCMGAAIDDIETDDVTLVSTVLDASASMSNFKSVVKEAYDKSIQAYKGSKTAGSILASTRTFHSSQNIIHGFKKVEEIDKIGSDYNPIGNSTALYDALIDALTGIKAYSKTLNDNGVRTKCVVVVYSDGEDNDSNKTAANVKTISKDLLASEKFYLVYVGFQHNQNDDLKKVASAMGFPNVLTAAATESEIRKAIDLVSKSIIRTSQTQIGKSNTFFN